MNLREAFKSSQAIVASVVALPDPTGKGDAMSEKTGEVARCTPIEMQHATIALADATDDATDAQLRGAKPDKASILVATNDATSAQLSSCIVPKKEPPKVARVAELFRPISAGELAASWHIQFPWGVVFMGCDPTKSRADVLATYPEAISCEPAQGCKQCQHSIRPGVGNLFCSNAERSDLVPAYGAGHPAKRLPIDEGKTCFEFSRN